MTQITPISAEGWWNAKSKIGGWIQLWGGALSLRDSELVMARAGILVLPQDLTVLFTKETMSGPWLARQSWGLITDVAEMRVPHDGQLAGKPPA